MLEPIFVQIWIDTRNSDFKQTHDIMDRKAIHMDNILIKSCAD